MSDIVKRVANMERRLRGLKAQRRVTIGQVQVLSEVWVYALTLDALGDPNDEARFEVTFVCGSNPIVDVGFDGFPVGVFEIIALGTEWQITGNTAVGYIGFQNSAPTVKSMTLTIRGWALNGISASIIRTL